MCNKCNSNKINCGCDKSQMCGCSVKLPMECVHYNGITLNPLQIEHGMDGNMVIKIINDYIKDFVDNLEIDPTIIENIGGKVEIYKGLSSMFVHEIKTIQGEDGIIVESLNSLPTTCDSGGDYINVRLDLDWLDNYICQKVQECGQPPIHTITTTNIVINLSNGATYTFTANDFLNHFNDSDPTHILEEVRLNNNVSNISYQGNPYVAGTWIPLSNITQLTFTSPNQNGTYTQIIPWQGKDNFGNTSN